MKSKLFYIAHLHNSRFEPLCQKTIACLEPGYSFLAKDVLILKSL